MTNTRTLAVLAGAAVALAACGSDKPAAQPATTAAGKGTLGPFVQQRIFLYGSADQASKLVSTFTSYAKSCTSYKDGENETKVLAFNAGALGDETFGVRVSSGASTDIVFTRVGNLVSQITTASAVASDSQLTIDVATKAAGKIAAR